MNISRFVVLSRLVGLARWKRCSCHSYSLAFWRSTGNTHFTRMDRVSATSTTTSLQPTSSGNSEKISAVQRTVPPCTPPKSVRKRKSTKLNGGLSNRVIFFQRKRNSYKSLNFLNRNRHSCTLHQDPPNREIHGNSNGSWFDRRSSGRPLVGNKNTTPAWKKGNQWYFRRRKNYVFFGNGPSEVMDLLQL